MSEVLVPFPVRATVLVRSRARPLAIVLVAIGLYLLRLVLGAEAEPGDLFQTGAGLTGYLVPLVFTGVCSDLDRSAGALWLQKPVSPLRFFLARFGEATAVTAALSVLLALCLGFAASLLDPGYSGSDIFAASGRLCLLALVLVSVGFGMSSWLPRSGALATTALLVLTFAIEIQTALGATGAAPPSVGLVRWFLLPIWALRDPYSIGESGHLSANLVWPFAYAAIWILIGALGIRHATRVPARRGRPPRGSSRPERATGPPHGGARP